MGGQTALNCALDLVREGVLEKFGVELIGASREAIDMAEDRGLFREAMTDIGLSTPRAHIVHSMEEAQQVHPTLGFPIIIRPSFTMGGSGGGIAYNKEEFVSICEHGLDLSPTTEVLLEESILGWKEFEMEVVRDRNDNCIIICSIENLDPMGVHTGDSITVAPAQTLTDKEYQLMRDASIAVLRKIGVETGGSNVQFAINPADGRMVVIEMNPRVSRSSALASKATGFPIAKVAAKLAVGFTLDELKNDITGGATPASFEPTIDYVVTKVPRFTFEKFPQAEPLLGTQMKSVGEVMAIGRTFQESLQKALRGLETGMDGLDEVFDLSKEDARAELRKELGISRPERLWLVADGFRAGMTLAELAEITAIDPWFLVQIGDLVTQEAGLGDVQLDSIDATHMLELKRKGFADRRLAKLLHTSEDAVRGHRQALNVRPVYKRVDTCAAEFATSTAYMYSTYEEECEAAPSQRDKIIVLGGGPNRIGQGIEFDYCCVHAALACREDGFETIMVNCNPETVSTDYDTSDRLYFEPLTLEDVLEIIHVEQPRGVIVQYGGQTPLKLSRGLEANGVPVIGTSADAIDHAEDRERFQQMVVKLGLLQPPNRIASTIEEAMAMADEVGYPLVVRPSYVLGGRAMEIVYSADDLQRYMHEAVQVSNDSPVLLDHFLNDAVEVDVDAICDGEDVLIGGIMEHIEQAGVHSGDSACSLPPYTLSESVQQRMSQQVASMARELNVNGLMNTQFAIKGDDIYLIEVNPRASRTVPYVSKATRRPLAKIAARVMTGRSLREQGFTEMARPDYFAVKEAVFPFIKFPGVDPLLGPEMKSTGEVMGIGRTFGEAFAKAQLGAGNAVPDGGTAFLSVRKTDRAAVVGLARELVDNGFRLVATRGTAASIKAEGIDCEVVNKVMEGRPHIVDMIKNGQIDLIVNTTEGKQSIADSYTIRRSALQHKVSYSTTLAGARATCMALEYLDTGNVISLQGLHGDYAG
jgi:carbamoyl-phosphate synthase large subunit